MLDWNNNPIRTPDEIESANPCVRLYGVGPAETTCAECVHLHRYHQAATWYKCDQRPKHKRGLSGDHKVRFPACKRYEVRMQIITPEQVIAEYQSSSWKKTAPTRIKKILTLADIEAEPEPFFFDLEGRKHEVKIGRCICVGVEGERWTSSLESVMRDRYPVGEEDEQGYQAYKMKNPRPVLCFDIPFPFILRIPGKPDWQCSDPTGAILTWNGVIGSNLDMRIVKRSVFEKTYERE